MISILFGFLHLDCFCRIALKQPNDDHAVPGHGRLRIG